MSASSKKKLRKEQNAALLTEKQLKEQAEAKKLKRNTGLFIAIISITLCAFLAISAFSLITAQGWVERLTTAATVNGEKVNSGEFNYYFIDAINNEYSQYGDYAESMFQMMGLDTSKPLDQQVYNQETGETWADYFIAKATSQMQYDYALAAAAEKAGYTLPEDEQITKDTLQSNLDLYAAFSGLTSGNAYLRTQYGNGANVNSYFEYVERQTLAYSYYNHYNSELSFDEAAIAEKNDENPLNYNAYDFVYYYVDHQDYLGVTLNTEETEETVGPTESVEATEEATEAATEEATEAATEEATEPTTEEKVEYTAEQIAEALANAKIIADKLALSESAEAFEAAVAELEVGGKKEETVNHSHNTLYTKISTIYNEWLAEEGRTEGNIAVFENKTTTAAEDGTETSEVKGYYVVCFEGMSDNRYAMSDVRHLLVKFTDDDEAEVTEDMKTTAKQTAESLLQEWKDGEADEDSFAALVNEHTDDEGSATTGGLYERIYEKSSYVENFLNWSIAEERTEGETAIIETEYGYHIMYFVKRHETDYRNYMITEELRAAALETWYNAQLETVKVETVNTSKLSTDMVLASN